MPEAKPREFAAIPIVILVLGAVFALALLSEWGAWGWVLFGIVTVVAVVILFLLVARRTKHPSELDAPVTAPRRTGADGTFRVVVVCDDACTSAELADAVVAHAGGRQVEVFVVAPALGSRLARWTGDDAGRASAADHLEATLAALEAAGLRARGEVGSQDPVQAADDALREFPADELVFAVHPDSQANWLERDVLDIARGRYDVPVTHVVVGTAS